MLEHRHFELKSGEVMGMCCLWRERIPSGICLKVNRRINGKPWLPALSSDHWITLKGNLFDHPMSSCCPSLKLVKNLLQHFNGFISYLGKKYLLLKNTPNNCTVLTFKLGSSDQGLFWAHVGCSLLLCVQALKMLMEIFCNFIPKFPVAQKFSLAPSFLTPWFLSPDLYWLCQAMLHSKSEGKCPETNNTHWYIMNTE